MPALGRVVVALALASVLAACTSATAPTAVSTGTAATSGPAATTAVAAATGGAGRTPSAASTATAGPSPSPSSTPTPAASATPPATSAAGGIDVVLKEFSVTPAVGAARAGSVAFAVRNAGAIPHEFLVVQTDLPPDRLPQKEQKAVDETAVRVVLRVEVIDGGQRATVVGTLSPGRYVLLCNVPSHYETGMYAAFTVQ